MRFLHLVFAAWIVLTLADCCAGKPWRGIVPLKSTRADVERLLGPSTGPLTTYYLSDVTVYFQYASCRCGEKCKDDWNVPPGTVIVINVGMKGVVKLADLNIDLTDFKKLPGDEDIPGSFIYKNDEDGFAIEGGGDYVSALIYGPRAKDEHLRCPQHNTRRENCKRTGLRKQRQRYRRRTGGSIAMVVPLSILPLEQQSPRHLRFVQSVLHGEFRRTPNTPHSTRSYAKARRDAKL